MTTDVITLAQALIAEKDARIAELRTEVERLETERARWERAAQTNWNEFSGEMKAQLQAAAERGVVLPDRANENEGNAYAVMQAMARNQALDEVARLNSPPVIAGDGMCNEENPELRCICREELGHRVCVSAGVPDEREAFEAAYQAVCDNGFTNVKNMARQIWQARAALPAKAEGGGRQSHRLAKVPTPGGRVLAKLCIVECES